MKYILVFLFMTSCTYTYHLTIIEDDIGGDSELFISESGENVGMVHENLNQELFVDTTMTEVIYGMDTIINGFHFYGIWDSDELDTLRSSDLWYDDGSYPCRGINVPLPKYELRIEGDTTREDTLRLHNNFGFKFK